ncbi:hypothetical protein PCIT_a1268 [Pseudoalteromonas citrea]|uniref:Uncharacterized protein n=2 Tax=Pseudoalteromonas citrea TaxID=43655 RepID=A0AAD4AMB3_9GAMM|nr:hypothetical protein [Pseudoalteromonas citrea]KAF7775149.1 hypothetical protein PCIT_a1268 [Pseudoalteromonas citrea]
MKPHTTIKARHSMSVRPKSQHTTQNITSFFQHHLFKKNSELQSLKEENQHLKLQLCRYKALTNKFFEKLQRIKARSQLQLLTLSSVNKRLERHVSRLQRLSIQLIRHRSQSQQQLNQQRITIQNIQHTLTTKNHELITAAHSYTQLVSGHTCCKAELQNSNQSNHQLQKRNFRLRVGIAALVTINLTLLTVLILL